MTSRLGCQRLRLAAAYLSAVLLLWCGAALADPFVARQIAAGGGGTRGAHVVATAAADFRMHAIGQSQPAGNWGQWTLLGVGAYGFIQSVVPTVAGSVYNYFAFGGADGAIYHGRTDRRDQSGLVFENIGLPGAKALSVVQLPGHGLQVIAIGADNAVSTIWQDQPNGPWSTWEPMGGWASRVSAVINANGGIEVYVIGSDNAVWRNWEDSAGGAWKGWQSLGGWGREVAAAVTSRPNGGVEVHIIGSDDAVWHRWQDASLGNWSNWESMGGSFSGGLVAKPLAPAGIGVFAIATDGVVQARQQKTPFGDWFDWQSVAGATAQSIAVTPTQQGGAEIYAVSANGTVNHAWRERPNLGWTAWTALDFEPADGRIATLNFNPSGLDNVEGKPWRVRAERLVDWLAQHIAVPDIIALQQVDGWLQAPPPVGVSRDCGLGYGGSSGDYDQFDYFMQLLRDKLGVTYRIAYMTGKPDTNPHAPVVGQPFCFLYSGHAMLYNPARLVNLTASTPISATRAHDDTEGLNGVPHLRRSLPICNRGTGLMPLRELIDGPMQQDKCANTPSGPAWAVMRDGKHIAATFNRFAFVDEPSSAIDVYNLNPNSGDEDPDIELTRKLITAVPPARDAGLNLFYPPLVIGDMNSSHVAKISSDYECLSMGIEEQTGIGRSNAFPARNTAVTDRNLLIPDTQATPGCPPSPLPPPGCYGTADTLISDHCAIFFTFKRESAEEALRSVTLYGPNSVVEGQPYRLTTAVAGGGSRALTYAWNPAGPMSPLIDVTAGAAGQPQTWQVTVSDGRTSVTAGHTVQVRRDTSACEAQCANDHAACMSGDLTGAGPGPLRGGTGGSPAGCAAAERICKQRCSASP